LGGGEGCLRVRRLPLQRLQLLLLRRDLRGKLLSLRLSVAP